MLQVSCREDRCRDDRCRDDFPSWSGLWCLREALEDNALGCYLQGVIADQGSSNHLGSLSYLQALLRADTSMYSDLEP